MNVLEVKHLSKSFDGKTVVDDVSFTVKPRRIVGLLGKNGCGKTTVIKMINDLLTPTKGEVLIEGKKVGKESKALVSYLPERTYLKSYQKVSEIFKFFQDFYPDFDIEKARKLLTDLGLDENERLAKMSKGMKEKIGLVLVMSRRAKLYVLDEPLGGVDPATRDYILETILKNFSEDASLLITTHLIADVEKILDDVIFMNDGKILLEASADELREKTGASVDETFRRMLK